MFSYVDLYFLRPKQNIKENQFCGDYGHKCRRSNVTIKMLLELQWTFILLETCNQSYKIPHPDGHHGKKN